MSGPDPHTNEPHTRLSELLGKLLDAGRVDQLLVLKS